MENITVSTDKVFCLINMERNKQTFLLPHFISAVYLHVFVAASSAPTAALGDVKTDSLTINVTGNSKITFDTYCVKMANEQKCWTNDTKGSDVINITGLTTGTNYTFHVYTVWKGVLSEHYTPIQSFTS